MPQVPEESGVDGEEEMPSEHDNTTSDPDDEQSGNGEEIHMDESRKISPKGKCMEDVAKTATASAESVKQDSGKCDPTDLENKDLEEEDSAKLLGSDASMEAAMNLSLS